MPLSRHLDPLVGHVVAFAGVFGPGPDGVECLLDEGQDVLVFLDPLMNLKLHLGKFFRERPNREIRQAQLLLGHVVEDHVFNQLIVPLQIQLIPTGRSSDPVLDVFAAVRGSRELDVLIGLVDYQLEDEEAFHELYIALLTRDGEALHILHTGGVVMCDRIFRRVKHADEEHQS